MDVTTAAKVRRVLLEKDSLARVSGPMGDEEGIDANKAASVASELGQGEATSQWSLASHGRKDLSGQESV